MIYSFVYYARATPSLKRWGSSLFQLYRGHRHSRPFSNTQNIALEKSLDAADIQVFSKLVESAQRGVANGLCAVRPIMAVTGRGCTVASAYQARTPAVHCQVGSSIFRSADRPKKKEIGGGWRWRGRALDSIDLLLQRPGSLLGRLLTL